MLSGPAMTDHQRRALLRRHEHQTRRCGCYRQQTRRTPLPRPIMAADLGPNVSAAAAAACMSAGSRVWWWAVSRSRTPTTRCRAGAYATGITPGVCVRALDVRGRGCAGDGAAAEARRPTAAHTREEGRTSRMTKISVGLGVSRHRLNNRGRRMGPSYRKAAILTASSGQP